ncbi:hypothetical protein [Nostoc sp. MG11]|uniref:hypothetical protein n=1 Tax=Nostoc sp. MG11 TaxID=2721166 RepID=UPI001868E881|nr:hypothetical protein [Nostoc sp. MG11]
MKSTQRPSKPPQQQPKTNDPTLKPELVAYKPVEKQQPTSQPDPSKSNEPPQAELQAEPQARYLSTCRRAFTLTINRYL